MKKINIIILSFVLVCVFIPRVVAHAYVLADRPPVTNPLDVGIYCSNETDASQIYTYAKKWNQCPEIYVHETNTVVATIHASVTSNDSGAYAITYSYSSDNHSIVFYHAWQIASESVQNETIVHEVGHALGLAHTQPINDENSVMREYGFNNKAYPLSDDKEGIAALY